MQEIISRKINKRKKKCGCNQKRRRVEVFIRPDIKFE